MLIQDISIYETILQGLPTGIIIYNPEQEKLKLNLRAQEILKLEDRPEQMLLKQLPAYLEAMKVLLRTTGSDIAYAEMRFLVPAESNDTNVVLSYSLQTLESEGTPLYKVLSFSDITGEHQNRLAVDRIKEEFFHAQKLASIGSMVSQVAHGLTNPLSGISMSTQLAKMSLEKLQQQLKVVNQESLDKNLESALSEVSQVGLACQKAALLTQDLLQYTKPTELNLSLENINILVSELIQILKSHPRFSGLQFKLATLAKPIPVLCDKVKLEQVFYNLFKNTSDATQGQGHVQINFQETDHQIMINIRDNGPGIDPELIRHVFEPFFTTKGATNVGLGLSISTQTIEQHGGFLSVENLPEHGAEFHVVLPKFTEAEASV